MSSEPGTSSTWVSCELRVLIPNARRQEDEARKEREAAGKRRPSCRSARRARYAHEEPLPSAIPGVVCVAHALESSASRQSCSMSIVRPGTARDWTRPPTRTRRPRYSSGA